MITLLLSNLLCFMTAINQTTCVVQYHFDILTSDIVELIPRNSIVCELPKYEFPLNINHSFDCKTYSTCLVISSDNDKRLVKEDCSKINKYL